MNIDLYFFWHSSVWADSILISGGLGRSSLPESHFVKAGAALNDSTFFAVCTGWQVVILQPASHIHNPEGGRAPALAEWGTLSSLWGNVSGLKENPHHPATGGLWAQWENEDLCAPLNPQEFLIKQGSRAAEGPHPPPVRGLPLWQGEWNSPLHFVLAAGY